MPKFAANLSTQFTELPFAERFAAAAEAGFTAVEFLFPYDYPATQIKQWLDDNQLQLVLFNTAPGNVAAGEWVFRPSRTGSGSKGGYRSRPELCAGAELPAGAHHGGDGAARR